MVKKTKVKKGAVSKVWMVSREYEGLAGAGGVKDVCRQLSEALARRGRCTVRVVLPRYGFMDPVALGFKPLQLPCESPLSKGSRFSVDMNYVDEQRREIVSVWRGLVNKVTVFLIEAERYAEKRDVYTYTAEEEEGNPSQRRGMGHYDYFAMNILLQKAALDLMILLDERPDVIHCHDGHTAVLPAMLREMEGYRHYFRHIGAAVTIHNAGKGYHQEVADLEFAEAVTGLPGKVIAKGELHGAFDPFMAAAPYAPLCTVSENYARELQETDEDIRTGMLGHELAARSVWLRGITNGINPADFDARDPQHLGLWAGFDPLGDISGKRVNKRELALLLSDDDQDLGPVHRYGRLDPGADRPLLTFIGRLTAQKGLDILTQALRELLEEDQDFSFLLLGTGAPEHEQEVSRIAADQRYKGRFCFLRGYSPSLALKIYAAGDFFLVPSLYEPCGLTDYIAQLLGNLPVVHSVGGLVKVIDGESGFVYGEHSPRALADTVYRALALYRSAPDKISAMQRGAVERIGKYHSWDKVMEQYLDFYNNARAMAYATHGLW